MSTITLDQLREDVGRRYAPLVIDLGGGVTVTLRQALRLPKEARREISAQQAVLSGLKDEDPDAEDKVVAALGAMLRTAATDKSEADRLLEAVGDDLALLETIMERYGEATQLPEASPSPRS